MNRLAALVRPLASLRLTLFLLVALAVTSAYGERGNMTWPLAIPLALLSLNLLVALCIHPAMRKTAWLFAFHLALLMLLLVAALGRLTYLKARIEVTEGQRFDGVPVEVEQGPWHRNRLDRIGFINDRLVIDYSPLRTITGTTNQVRWQDASGQWQTSTLRENEPQHIFGYRFYVTSGKGFAPVFRWQPRNGNESVGAVHLPRFPSDEFAQQTEWTLPDQRTKVWAQLLFDAPVVPAGQVSQLHARQDSRVVLWISPPSTENASSVRYALRPGEAAELPGGRLEYRELRLWMGYLVHYDWTVPWMLAISALATIALCGHFLSRFSVPWDGGEKTVEDTANEAITNDGPART